MKTLGLYDCMCDCGTALQLLLLCGSQVPGVDQNFIIYALEEVADFPRRYREVRFQTFLSLDGYDFSEDTALESIH